MSGLEILSVVAAASQLAEQGIKIINLCSKIRGAPESVSKHSDEVKQLVEVARLIAKNQSLQSDPFDSILRQCITKATSLQVILNKICADADDGTVIKWKKAVVAAAKDKEILSLLSELERKKSSLLLLIAAVDS